MNIDPDWDLYRSFLAVLDHGSLLAAARATGMAQPTIGRHIDALETALSVTLFIRSHQGFAPTDIALVLRPYAQAMQANAASLLRAAGDADEEIAGTVRVTASEVVGAEVLPPMIDRLLLDHPGIKVELVLSNRAQDLLRREADIAVRMVRPAQEALVARRIGAIGLGMYAHPRYIERAGPPRTMKDLKDHRLIGHDTETAFIRALREKVGGITRDQFALRTDSDLAQLAAIRAGVGIGICQSALARRAGLVRVLPSAVNLELETWVAMHADLRTIPRCRAVFDSLAQGLAEYIAEAAPAPARAPHATRTRASRATHKPR